MVVCLQVLVHSGLEVFTILHTLHELILSSAAGYKLNSFWYSPYMALQIWSILQSAGRKPIKQSRIEYDGIFLLSNLDNDFFQVAETKT